MKPAKKVGWWGCVLVVGLTIGVPVVRAKVLYVKADATGQNDGTSWADAFVELTEALFSARRGDEVWVAAGTYWPFTFLGERDPREATFNLVSGVTVLGGFAGNEAGRAERAGLFDETILSGALGCRSDCFRLSTRNAYHVVTAIGTDATGVLDGFTIRHGYAWPGYTRSTTDRRLRGGGMLIIGGGPTVNNCRFVENTATYGGGMYIEDGEPNLSNCRFVRNTAMRSIDSSGAEAFGGGVFNQGAGRLTLTNCTFRENRLNTDDGNGGGIYSYGGSLMLENCKFIENEAFTSLLGAMGGGIAFVASDAEFVRCDFMGNDAGVGGGVGCTGVARLTFVGCVFDGNSTSGAGGGIFVKGDEGERSVGRFINCVFTGNQSRFRVVSELPVGSGGAGHFSALDEVSMVNCTMVSNRAGFGPAFVFEKRTDAIGPAQFLIRNSIVRNGGDDIVSDIDVALTITYSNVEGGFAGEGNFDVVPRFAASGHWDDGAGEYPFRDVWNNGDYHLTPASPGIDAGDNLAVPEDIVVDVDGGPRFVDVATMPDTGKGTSPIVDIGAYEFSDCNGNTISDRKDIADGTSVDCDGNGVPDVCDIDEDGSRDCDGDGVLDACSRPQMCSIGDFDRDGDADLADFLFMMECFSGPGATPQPRCCTDQTDTPACNAPADLDRDGDIDLADVTIFQSGFTGTR